jgi:sulfoxide reductase heme-binding subunit YedZ
MQNTFWQSHWPIRFLLAVPAIVILSRFQFGTGGFGHFITATGEWSARLLIVTLAVTPIRMMFKGRLWPLWLFKRRRDLGVAAFLYAVMHLAAYLIHEGSPGIVIADLATLRIILGWIALFAMLVPFALSNQEALHELGPNWKSWQRLVYLSAIATLFHWLLISKDWAAALIQFAPLAALEAYRLWYNFMRPSRHRPG